MMLNQFESIYFYQRYKKELFHRITQGKGRKHECTMNIKNMITSEPLCLNTKRGLRYNRNSAQIITETSPYESNPKFANSVDNSLLIMRASSNKNCSPFAFICSHSPKAVQKFFKCFLLR